MSHPRQPSAADSYGQILDRLSSADTGKETMSSPGGREALARLVEEMAELESEAFGSLDKALAAATT